MATICVLAVGSLGALHAVQGEKLLEIDFAGVFHLARVISLAAVGLAALHRVQTE
jgi:hypothetical protein